MDTHNDNRPGNSPEEMKDDAREMPLDPSNTSHIGENAGIGVIGIQDHFTDQDNKWEDNMSGKSQLFEGQAENYLKNPSPEEFNHDVERDNADDTMEAKDDVKQQD